MTTKSQNGLVVMKLCGVDQDVQRRVYELCVYDAISKDHDNPIRSDLEWFYQSHASRF